MAFPPTRLLPSLRRLVRDTGVIEASIISTCNRTEVVVAQEDAGSRDAVEWFIKSGARSRENLARSLHHFSGAGAARHLFRVAGGLDSMILGEPQILGQVKQAYEVARDAGTVGKLLNRLYQQAFAVAKRIRTDTAVGANPVSIAYAAVTLARQIFGDLADKTVLVLGAGDTAELVVKHLSSAGLGRLIVANRTVSRAQRLASQCGGVAVGLAALPSYLAQADVVIASTNSLLPIVGKGLVESAIRERRRKPMFMVDLAVPRDIEPEVQSLPDVYLYSIDDLHQVVTENLKSRQGAAAEADRIVDRYVEEFEDWWNTQHVIPIVREFRGQVDTIRGLELERALAELQRGKAPAEVATRLARALANKLAHAPSVRIKRAGEEGDLEALRVLRRLFGSDQDPEQ